MADTATRTQAAARAAPVLSTRRLAAWWSAWRTAVLTGAGYFLAARALTELVALIAAYGSSFVTVVRHDPNAAIRVWGHWDAVWYLQIANQGYTDNHLAAFPPLPPLLVGGISRITHVDTLVVSLVVAFAVGVIACVLLYRLVQRDFGDRVASLAVFLLLTFPTALFLQSFYAEGLLLLFAVASFLAVRSGRLLLAGVLIACAALCKTYAVILFVPLLVEYFHGRKWDWSLALGAGALLALPPVAAVAGWATYLGQRFGDPSLVVTAEGFWGRHLAPPWVAIFDGLNNIRTFHLVEGMDLVSVVLLIVAAVYAWMRMRRSYAVLLALSALVFTSSSVLLSSGRFTVAVFPLFIVTAAIASRRAWLERLWPAVFIPLGVYYLAAFATSRWAG
jgi:hypothetical protein